MFLDPPAAGVIAEIGDHHLRGGEGSVRLRARHPDPGIAEADDVGPAVAGGVGHEARMFLDPPAAGVIAEIADHHLRGEECSVRLSRAIPRPRHRRSRRCRLGRRLWCRP